MFPSTRPCCCCGLSLEMAVLLAMQGQKGRWGDFSAGVWLPPGNQVHWHSGQWREQAVPGGLWVTGSCLTSSQMQRLALSSGHPGGGPSRVALVYWGWHCWLGIGGRKKHGVIPG